MTQLDESSHHKLANIVCNKQFETSFDDCYNFCREHYSPCKEYGRCRIKEKSQEQIDYILEDIDQNTFLEACPGSGKTETVGLKAAYEIKKWNAKHSGIAVLTFTNNATDVIKDRAYQFSRTTNVSYPHYIGTIDSWLHGYLFNPFNYLVLNLEEQGNLDHSVQIIENSSTANFLKNDIFCTNYQYFNRGKIPAHQYYFLEPELKSVYFSSGDSQIDNVRNSKSQELEKWEIGDLRKAKNRFWEHGFATHQDVELISLKLLTENENICRRLSERFPYIMIDECQDLSKIKLQIFNLLRKQGTFIQLIGDPNQSIYYDEDQLSIKQYCIDENFTNLKLSLNFRSVQSIINFYSKIIPNENKIIGCKDQGDIQHCTLFSYEEESMTDLIEKFERLIIESDCDISNSSIFVRNRKLKNRLLSNNPDIDFNPSFYPPLAIYYWKKSELSFKKDSLSKMGFFLYDRIFAKLPYDSNNFFSPRFIENHKWRFFLAELLNDCCLDNTISNLDLEWNKWRKGFDDKFHELIIKKKQTYDWLPLDKIDNVKLIRVPRGKKSLSKLPVIETLKTNHNNSKYSIPINTIHSSKGMTYDAILLVSDKSNKGQKINSGSKYWKNWIDIEHDLGESSRLAYVASSRPKKILAWAIPKKDYNETNVNSLKKLGLIPIDHITPINNGLEKGQTTLFD